MAETGIIFDCTRSFAIRTASICYGVDGSVEQTFSVYELEPGTTNRTALLAQRTSVARGVLAFDIFQRIDGSTRPDDPLYFWFDVPKSFRFVDDVRYEVVFSNPRIVSGVETYPGNWQYGQPLYDNEGRAYGRPYDVCRLMHVVDGTSRGTRATLLPFVLFNVR
jgi:hypothetical protein